MQSFLSWRSRLYLHDWTLEACDLISHILLAQSSRHILAISQTHITSSLHLLFSLPGTPPLKQSRSLCLASIRCLLKLPQCFPSDPEALPLLILLLSFFPEICFSSELPLLSDALLKPTPTLLHSSTECKCHEDRNWRVFCLQLGISSN